MAAERHDRIGIGWRDPLAAGLYAHLDDIDVVEVIAENCVAASARHLRSLRALGREVPLLLHGVALGPASVSTVDTRHLARIARVAGVLEPCAWSEHLSFVRSGGHEIGHLAAPPRNAITVEAAAQNILRLRAAIGMVPAMENIATLMDPPASTLAEPEWVAAIAAEADVPLLLDLHNLFANAVNFGFEPQAYLRRFPLDRVRVVHLSGGEWMDAPPGGEGRRLVDDHRHDPPAEVYELLETLGARCPQALSIVLERDGRFPSMTVLLGQLRQARRALAAGRTRQTHAGVAASRGETAAMAPT